ncbi:MAG: ACT domain-containing protein [Deltaproteobacteria bacterium]
MSEKIISSYTVTHCVSLITMDNVPNNPKIISEIFNAIAKQNINVDMITQSPSYRGILNISFTIPGEDMSKAITALAKFKKEIPTLRLDISSNNTKICVSGEGMRTIPGVAASVFTVLSKIEIEIKLVTTSETDISYLVSNEDEESALRAIKEEYSF